MLEPMPIWNWLSPPTSYYRFNFINILSIVIIFASFIFFYIFIIIMTRFVFLWNCALAHASLQHVIHVLLHFCNIPKKCLMIRSKRMVFIYLLTYMCTHDTIANYFTHCMIFVNVKEKKWPKTKIIYIADVFCVK